MEDTIRPEVNSAALSGLKVADFTWALGGPLVTKCLADHGATVIRVESPKRPCPMRASAPWKDGIPGLDRSGYYACLNSNKYSLALDLGQEKGRDVAKKLIVWADIVAENFVPGTMERWGLGYEELRKIKPDIIMLRSSGQGQVGPRATHPGTGIQLAGLAAFPEITGWPDRSPQQPSGGYSDLVSTYFGIASVIAALCYREQTGKGQLIDLSQYEATLQFVAPPILRYLVDNKDAERTGNSSPCAAPHGVYRCLGDDRWCAIAVSSQEEWQAFCRVVGDPAWTKEPRFATLLGRKRNEPELDRLVEEWTSTHTAEEVMTLMQSAGVAAGVVENAKDTFDDPQLKVREHFKVLKHPEIGLFPYPGQAFKLSKTPAEFRMPSPCLGEHTEYVCREILGIPEEEFNGLLAAGIIK